MAQTIPPAMQETWVRSLGWQDPLEEEMITHSSILAWRIPWIEEPGGLQSMGLQKSMGMTEQLNNSNDVFKVHPSCNISQTLLPF